MGIMEIPLFVNEVLHLDVTKSGLFTAIPNVISFIVSLGFAVLVDYFLKKGHDVTKTRKVTQLIAFIGPSVCLALLIYIKKLVDYQVLILLIFTSVFGILTTSGLLISFLDTCGQFSATVFGLSNSLANCTGFLVPALTGFFTDQNQSRESWNLVLLVYIGFQISGAILFGCFMNCEQLEWTKENEDENPLID